MHWSGKKFIITITTIILVVIICLGLIFFGRNNSYIDILSYIPKKSTFIIELNNFGYPFNKELKKLELEKGLNQIPEIKTFSSILQSGTIIIDKYEDKASFLAPPLYLSAIPDSNGSIDILYAVSLKGKNLRGKLRKVISDVGNFPDVQEVPKQKNLYIFSNSKNQDSLFFASRGNVCLFSTNKDAVISSLVAHKDSSSLKSDANFIKLKEKTGKNVSAYLFINYKSFDPIVSKIFGKKEDYPENIINSFGNWTGLDLFLGQKNIFFSGFTFEDSKRSTFLNCFKDQSPQSKDILKLAPYNTIFCLDFGVSDFPNFYKNFKSFLDKKAYLKKFIQPQYVIENKHKVNLYHSFISNIGTELGLFYFPLSRSNFEAVFYSKLNNVNRSVKGLNSLALNTKGNSSVEVYRDTKIGVIKINNLIPAIFGNYFSDIQNSYYLILEDFLFVGNNIRVLESIVDNYKSGKTLDINPNFKSFADNLSNESNIFFYSNIRNGLPFIVEGLSDDLKKWAAINETALKSFEAFSGEFSLQKDLWYTSYSLKYNPDYKEEDNSSWVYSLDADAASSPYLVYNHTSKTNNIIVFDKQNNMYLLDQDGNRLWKKPIEGNILSRVYSVDYYKNGKYQYLFNTDKKLYLVDLNSDDVAKYPITLNSDITNGLALFDYSNNKDYRILLSNNKNFTVNYDILGNSIKGWSPPKSKETITQPVEHLISGGRDYIFITDKNGNTQILDRRGKRRIKLSKGFNKAVNSKFYPNNTNSKGPIITTNKEGKLTYINTNGSLKYTDFGEFSENHYFLYNDLDQAKGNDFIFIDGKQLVVYDRFKKNLVDCQLPSEPAFQPEIIKLSSGKKYIAMIGKENHYIYLIDKKGKSNYTKTFESDFPYAVNVDSKRNINNLIVCKGKNVFSYILK
ncbi:MAG: hypothetical protein ACEPOV_06095 [Hyphomicrobiales bacterium]